MLVPFENRNIFIAAKPVDFRMSIDGLSRFIQTEKNTHIYDGSLYVFTNANRDKIKVLFWDGNGFVLYYKRLDKCKFHIQDRLNAVEKITGEELAVLLSGFDPRNVQRQPQLLEHQP